MKVIITTYFVQTDTQWARFAASVEGHRATIRRNYELDMVENHAAAAMALRHKLGWKGKLVGGILPDGNMAWVPKDEIEIE
jgi:hypothetical protein